ncbi:MAG: peroxiredoxin, partial [Anaerolineae bacterium]
MVAIGEMAPDFSLQSDTGETVSLSDYRGRKVVLYFYPKADTPGCTKQACALRDVYPNIEAENASVIGISPDEPEALVKFREKYALPF